MSFKSAVLAAAVVSLIGVTATAQAESVVVKIAGRDTAAAFNDVVQAAEKTCTAARKSDFLEEYGTQEECVAETLQGAVAVLAQQGAVVPYRMARYEGLDSQSLGSR